MFKVVAGDEQWSYALQPRVVGVGTGGISGRLLAKGKGW